MKQIAIIGGWAAGIMVAATIIEWANSPFHIHLFEKNNALGKKVLLSWGGRCNVTTAIRDREILKTKYTRGWQFIKKAIWKFSPEKCYHWFESHSVALKIEDDMRVFPISDRWSDIVSVFEDIFANNRDKMSIHYGEWVSTVNARNQWRRQENEQDFLLHSKWQEQWGFLIKTSKWVYEVDTLVITTWGNAYSQTGSSGDGYAFARSLGHSVTSLWPSLSSFLTWDTWLHELSGLAFHDAKVSWYSHCEEHSNPDNQQHGLPHSASLHSQWQKQELIWPLLLTHFGISWPLAFMVSSHLAFERIGKWYTKTLSFAPLKEMDEKAWDIYLTESFINNPKKYLIGILSERIPRRFAEAFIKEYFAHIEVTFAGSISRIDRERVSKLLGGWINFTVLERRPWDEFVTAWWVSTDQLDPETMESKLHKNLYFAGEVLNVDGYTWGFSLQMCWASGYVVGKDIALNS